METIATLPGDGRDARKRHDWEKLAKAARKPKNRGLWVKFNERVNNGYSAQINRGALKAFRPAGDYEAATRNTKEDGADLYVRYVGKD